MKQLRSDGWVARALQSLADAVCEHPRWFLWPQVMLFGLCVFFTVNNLKFNTDRSALVGADKKYQKIFQEFQKEFPSPKDLVVVVESDDTEKNRQFVERLGAKLETRTNLFRTVFFRTDLRMLGPKALQFVPLDDLAELQKTLRSFRPFLDHFTHATNLVSLFDVINEQFTNAKQEKTEQTDALIKALPALERIVRLARDAVQRPGAPPSPGVVGLFNAGAAADRRSYVTFDEGRVYLVTACPHQSRQNAEAIAVMRGLIEETQEEVPGLNAGLTGESVLELDEMRQSQKDSTLASLLSLVLCALIFIYGYRETGRPVKATLCLIVGVGYTMGFTTLAVGHLNILTITFVPILIGLAIDFGVHLVTRYEEELRHGLSERDAITKALVFTGQGIITGALTTAGAFLAMGFTDFKGIQEMGIICGGGLIVCLIPMMTLLPVLLLQGRQNVLDHEPGAALDHRQRIERLWLDRPGWVIGLTIGWCALSLWLARGVYFDYNLLDMQSAGLPAVEYENKLLEAARQTDASPRSLLFGVVTAKSPAEARQLEMRLTNLTTVAGVESLGRFLTDEQTNKFPAIRAIVKDLEGVEFHPTDARPLNMLELSRTMYSFQGLLGAAHEQVKTKKPELAGTFLSLQKAVEQLRRAMLTGSEREIRERGATLGVFQRALFDDLRMTFAVLQHQDTTGPLTVADLPMALRDRFVGVTGKHLLQVYPKQDVWQRQHQETFVKEVRTVFADLTGTPVQLYEYTSLLKKSYQWAAAYALAAIAVLVLFHFRSLSALVLALLPVAIGAIWLGGFMGFHSVPFNPANIMTLPLVIGIGVTNGIHILNRFAEEQHPSILGKSTGKAVLVSGLTTCAGFGSLIIAQHRGIATLGSVMTVGVATCMIAGLAVLPAILTLLVRRQGKKKQPSADNARSTLGREEPR